MAEPRGRSGAKGRSGGAHGTPSEATGGLGAEHSFSLQAIFEIQRSVGRLEGSVGRLEGKVENLSKQVKQLSEQAKQQQRAIGWITRTLWVAAGALLILGPMVAWILNNRFDLILDALANGG